MQNENITIRNFCRKDIPKAMKLVLDEGWNQTKKDWELFLENPLNSCKCAEINGQLVGTAASYNYAKKVAWISMVLVDKNFRGQGISKKLVKAVLDELKGCALIKLDATPAGLNVYKKLGFVEEYKISRMVNSSIENGLITDFSQSAKQINSSDIPSIIHFDKRIFGAERTSLFKSWINDFPEKCRIVIHDNQIAGFLLGRTGNKYQQPGPLSANSLSNAKILVAEVLRNCEGKGVVLDVPDEKQEFVNWLKTIGFQRKRGFTRMFLSNNISQLEIGKQFLIGGPEFG